MVFRTVVATLTVAVAGAAGWLALRCSGAGPGSGPAKAAAGEADDDQTAGPVAWSGATDPRTEETPRALVSDGEDLPSRLPDELGAFVAGHLGPAPMDLQRLARARVESELANFRRQANLIVPDSVQSALALTDAQFSIRLREVAVERLTNGKGLLAIEGLDYEPRVAGKHYYLALSVDHHLGRQVGVLAVVDEPDFALQAAERANLDMQRVAAFDRMTAFNARPPEERQQRVAKFLAERERGRSVPAELGLTWPDLAHVRVDEASSSLLMR